ncbi:MAG: hypothetical protein H7A21_13495 [Spirochaetales bacterium]|nr:hypothetical protein [Leptospiraceae bacterium]MCP5482444.1 hypothetical protein [Spirochaetales bacterium]MCP5485852.1 hypothetical protein [Spirochaetales bacterium]
MIWLTAGIVLHLAATLYMTGLIFFVQIVHYPLFEEVSEINFARFEARHRFRTTIAVLPMAFEFLSTPLLFFVSVPGWIAVCLTALIVLNWVWTALVMVPGHRRLARARDEREIRRLVRNNAVRVVAWLARSVVLLILLGDGRLLPG